MPTKEPEPFELTKRFLDMTPGAFPGYSLLTAFGRAAPLNLDYQRAQRVLPFPFHFLNNNQAMNVRPKNYSWRDFYDHVIDLTGYSFSWRAIFRRLRRDARADLAVHEPGAGGFDGRALEGSSTTERFATGWRPTGSSSAILSRRPPTSRSLHRHDPRGSGVALGVAPGRGSASRSERVFEVRAKQGHGQRGIPPAVVPGQNPL